MPCLLDLSAMQVVRCSRPLAVAVIVLRLRAFKETRQFCRYGHCSDASHIAVRVIGPRRLHADRATPDALAFGSP
jgi:hypothetical protein